MGSPRSSQSNDSEYVSHIVIRVFNDGRLSPCSIADSDELLIPIRSENWIWLRPILFRNDRIRSPNCFLMSGMPLFYVYIAALSIPSGSS